MGQQYYFPCNQEIQSQYYEGGHEKWQRKRETQIGLIFMRKRSGLWLIGSRQDGKRSLQKHICGIYGRNGLEMILTICQMRDFKRSFHGLKR